MEELVINLVEKAGLSEEQAHSVILTIKEHLESKVPPMFRGFIDQFLGNAGGEDHGA